MSKDKTRNDRVKDHDCPVCGHHKAWGPRGYMMTMYHTKCCKCGMTDAELESKIKRR
jgi:hypothetical protein